MKQHKFMPLLAAAALCFSIAASPVRAEETGPYLVDPEPAPVLRDIQLGADAEHPSITKTYEVPPGYDPIRLSEAGFEKDGIQYAGTEPILLRENYQTQTKIVSQATAVSHENKGDVTALFAPILDYSMDGFSGQLQLDRASIATTSTGQKGYSYTVTDRREIAGLARNDTYAIPKTAVKNGVTLKLADISWTNLGTSYTATATYMGTGRGTKTTGYTSTACYMGEVCKEELVSRTYKIIYEGTLPPVPLPEPPVWPWVLAVSAAAMALAGILLAWRLHYNTRIYVLSGQRCHPAKRVHVSPVWPTVSLTAPALQPARDFIIVPDRWLAKRMEGAQVRILCADGNELLRYADLAECGGSLRIQLQDNAWKEDEF